MKANCHRYDSDNNCILKCYDIAMVGFAINNTFLVYVYNNNILYGQHQGSGNLSLFFLETRNPDGELNNIDVNVNCIIKNYISYNRIMRYLYL